MICERCGGDSGAYRMHPDPHVCIARLEADRDRLAGELHELSQLHQVQGVELTCLEREVARLAAMLHPQPLPCGHAAEHGHTSDGGATIQCCACERDRLAAELAEANVDIAALTAANGHDTAWIKELAASLGVDQPWCPNISATVDQLKADLARISLEMGLPPTIGPAPGELTRLLALYPAEREAHARTRATIDEQILKVLEPFTEHIKEVEARADRAEAALARLSEDAGCGVERVWQEKQRAEAILRGLEAKTMASKDDPEGELTASGATIVLAWLADLRAQVTS